MIPNGILCILGNKGGYVASTMGETLIGDKIRVLIGPLAGQRGTVLDLGAEMVSVRLSTGDITQFNIADLLNYSLAARRAWRTRPKRAGRPRGTRTSRKKMVSIRIDEDIWQALGRAVEEGLIPSREHAVNEWLRERVLSFRHR